MCWAGRALRCRGAAEDGALGAAGKAEPVHLADHRISRHISEFRGDLAGRKAGLPELFQLLDAIVGPGQYRHRTLPSLARRPSWRRRCDAKSRKIPCTQNPLALAGRKSAPERLRRTTRTQGIRLPHEMSYPTSKTLQYGVDSRAESGPTAPHVPSSEAYAKSLHCTGILRTDCARKALLRSIDTDCLAHKMFSRAALKRRHVSFSGAGSSMRRRQCAHRGRCNLNLQVTAMSTSATSHLLPVFARVDLGFERGEGCWLIATNGDRYLDFTSGVAVNALGHAHPASGQGAAGAGDKTLAHVEPVQEPGRRGPRGALVRAELCRLRVLLQFRRGSDGRRDQARAPLSLLQGTSASAIASSPSKAPSTAARWRRSPPPARPNISKVLARRWTASTRCRMATSTP